MDRPPLNAAKVFTVEELASAFELFYSDRDAAMTMAKLMMESSGGINYEHENILYSVLATLSDDCAVRVGRLRGQTAEEALASRDEFLRVNGGPESWEITTVEEDEEQLQEAAWYAGPWSPYILRGPTPHNLHHVLDTMKLSVYLNFPGHCEQAFRFYEQELGGKITMLQQHGQQPDSSRLPADWQGKILHARMELGGTVVMGADIPGAEPVRSAYLTLTVPTPEEAERLYALLSEGGQIFMKMEETFFAKRFAMLRDRFGTSWMLLCEPAAE